ncbi:MAG TPA: radical SAM protein, partial [Thermoplasmatales archaeon]|nr:radical SAM protein [Thermoplasmatales archaeon]
SIQGEGKLSGYPTIFIRLTGCNLRCRYCDTKYAYYDGIETSLNDIFSRIKSYPCRNVCITGGEPLLQKETPTLIKKLVDKKYRVFLETNGSIDLSDVVKIEPKKYVMISLDIKCPSSGMQDKMRFENINYLSEKDQLKFVISNREDYEYSKDVMDRFKPNCEIFMQPVWGWEAERLARWILEDGLNVRISLQLHKIVFGDKRGV